MTTTSDHICLLPVPLYEIALEIIADFELTGRTMSFALEQCVEAMLSLTNLGEAYLAEHSDIVVITFLDHASNWRGERRASAALNSEGP